MSMPPGRLVRTGIVSYIKNNEVVDEFASASANSAQNVDVLKKCKGCGIGLMAHNLSRG
ncbi:MAG: hypothetical protein NVSMB28_26370 [Collimonas sp.]